MLKNEVSTDYGLLDYKNSLIDNLPEDYYDFISDDDDIVEIEYPVIEYPTKVVSMKLDKVPVIHKKLMGIKGQYLIFDDGSVINLRSHAGYRIKLEV